MESKKRTRDGKPKKVPKAGKKEEAKTIEHKEEKGLKKDKQGKEDDGGRKMMTDKEAKIAIRDYMIKVSVVVL